MEMGQNCVLTGETCERNSPSARETLFSEEKNLGFAHAKCFLSVKKVHFTTETPGQCLFQILVLQTMGRSQGLASVVEHKRHLSEIIHNWLILIAMFGFRRIKQ